MKYSDLKPGDKVILHTFDTRYPDEVKIVKSVGPKWIKLNADYIKAKYSVIDGRANDERPGYEIIIPNEVDKDWEDAYNYMVTQVAPRYLKTLPLDKLRHLQRRWTHKILEYDENNPTVQESAL